MTDAVPQEGPPSLDLASAAARLGVHYQTAYRWVRDGSLPATRVLGKYRVDEAALDDFARRRQAPRPVSDLRQPVAWDRLATRFEEHLIAGDETAARNQALELHERGVAVVAIISNLFVPALRSIGEGWAAGRIGISEEHRASEMVTRFLGELSPRPRGRRRGTAVVTALTGEHHGLPTSMAAAALREDRWHVEHLATDLPAAEVVRFALERRPDVVVLSVTVPGQEAIVAHVSELLDQQGIPTLVGGPDRTLDDLCTLARAHSPAARRAAGAAEPTDEGG